MAPSTPPPPSSVVLAALTMASTASVTMLTCRASSRAFMSPSAGFEPSLDLIEPVRPPERLAVDDDVGGAEHPARDCRIHFGAQPLLDRGVIQRLRELYSVHFEPGRDVARHLGAGDIAVLREIGVIERLREPFRQRPILVIQPIKGAA